MQPTGNINVSFEGWHNGIQISQYEKNIKNPFDLFSFSLIIVCLLPSKLIFYTYGTTSNCIMKTTAMMNDKPDKPNIAASANVGISE